MSPQNAPPPFARFETAPRQHDVIVRLMEPDSRVQFVLAAWLGRLSPTAHDLERVGLADGRELSDRIRAMRFGTPSPHHDDRVRRSLEDLRELTVRLSPGDAAALEFARRVSLPVPEPRLSEVGDQIWWSEFRRTESPTPSIAVLAGHALQSHLRPFDDDGGSVDREPVDEVDHEEWIARHRLARVLLDAATTASGRANDAQRTLARLAPYLIDEIERFLATSPRWVPACHFLDRALRVKYRGASRPHPEVARVATRFVTEREDGRWNLLEKIRQRAPRSAASLRLARRVGREIERFEVRRDVTQLFLDAVIDPGLPVRARRFALWIAAENSRAIPEAGSTARQVDQLIEQFGSDPDLGDVAAVLRSFRGGYKEWDEGDYFNFEHDEDGAFEWPCSTSTHDILTKHILPAPWSDSGMFASPWDRLPRQLVFAARRMLLEMLVHPGLVRVKAASDTLASGGQAVASAVSRTLSLMLDDPDSAVLPDHVVEIAANTISHVRGDDSPLGALIRVAGSRRSADCRSAAIASLGDVLYRMRREDPDKSRRGLANAYDTLANSLDSADDAVVNAAIFAYQGLPIAAVSARLRALARSHPNSLTRDLALWRLETPSPD